MKHFGGFKGAALAAVTTGLFFASTAIAAPMVTTINDGYWGATESDRAKNGRRDIIGSASNFDITKIVSTLDASKNTLTFDIHLNFDPLRRNTGDWKLGNTDIDYGDLFLSTDGWNPYSLGTNGSTYSNDDSSNGESWDFVLQMDDHEAKKNSSGDAYLYETKDGTILNANYSSTHRKGQEVQFAAGDASSLLTASWSISSAGVLTYVIDWGLLTGLSAFDMDGDWLGVHYTMTCGNDVIEGAAEVPEPATMLLLGSGILGMGIRRKRQSA